MKTGRGIGAIEEKEKLLLELKKRVADNLQLLSSIVHLQQIHATDEPVKKALQTTHSRIMALSMVYETLFRFSDVESIVMQEYCTGLCDYLVSLYSEIGSKVQCSVSGIDISLSIEEGPSSGVGNKRAGVEQSSSCLRYRR